MTEPREVWWPSGHEWFRDPAAARDKAELNFAALGLGIGRATHLSKRGTCEPAADILHLRQRFRLCLEDMRRRRLSPHAPFGWPVLSIEQEATICRVVARLRKGATRSAGKRISIAADDADQVAHLLDVLQLLARTEWAEPAAEHQAPDPCIQDNRPR